jgi:hypothetical protein
LIFDPNGEYSNPNQQDKGALSEVYPQDTIRYRILKSPGFAPLLNDFYVQLQEGYNLIAEMIKQENYSGANQPDIQNFISGIDFSKPSAVNEIKRWKVKCALYRALLKKAGFPSQQNFTVEFEPSANIINIVNQKLQDKGKNPINPIQRNRLKLTLSTAIEWFEGAYEANSESELRSSSGKPWFDGDCISMLRMLVQKNANGSYINGYLILQNLKPYHQPGRDKDVCVEIYEHLRNGKIVIVDLSVGPAFLREKLSKDIGKYIFETQMKIFTEGNMPPNIVVYIEEAHNLIGKNDEITDTWPRLAKEGAKFRIALVYSTQEVSSIHPSILSATENWFVTHLNNENEIKQITKFYDFADFAYSLLKAQDVGFAKVKTLSSPFVVPVQIDLFDPQKIKNN